MNTTDKPLFQEFHIEGIKHISPVAAFEAVKRGKAIILDVREENELDFESILLDEVMYHPMSEIMDRLQHIPNNKSIIVACPGGVRSSKVANLLIMQGYKEVANLDGGLMMWKMQGLPFESHASMGCGCGSHGDLSENEATSGGCGCGCVPTSSGESCGSCC
jgi:rhodanese-related sulfurtransferase